MKAYGIDIRYDQGCCPDYDRYSKHAYSNNCSKRAQTRDTKKAHRAERRRQYYLLEKLKLDIWNIIEDILE